MPASPSTGDRTDLDLKERADATGVDAPAPVEPPTAAAGVAAGLDGIEDAVGTRASVADLAHDRWALRRAYMEAYKMRRDAAGRRPFQRFMIFASFLKCIGIGLKVARLYNLGRRNALDIRLNRVELDFPDLPPAFDGYTVLQLTDLHVDAMPELGDRLVELVSGLEVDALALTGDYRYDIKGDYRQVLPPIEAVARAVRTRDGRFAILGNHDPGEMAEPLERMGYRVLINEGLTLRRGADRIRLLGVDDVHYYYSRDASDALRDSRDGFTIALVHSPEMVEEAAAGGVSLYLTGHTHGGQVCTPAGRPIISNAAAGRRYASGVWRFGDMVGYTSVGIGVSGLPIRFFSRGEAALIVLRRTAA